MRCRKTAAWTSRGNDIMQTMRRYYSNTLRIAATTTLSPSSCIRRNSIDNMINNEPVFVIRIHFFREKQKILD
jgi:hypothetical protein